ncbi:MAG TPA: NYN domain-containing protein [Arenimonas sp.]|nr:NYN domain-containing protein [Arenimonas sp.]
MKLRGNGKNELEDGQRRLAVLIDADNAQASIIEGLLAEIARYGVASVKRIYGDWTSPHTAKWKKSLLKHSINPVQQFPYTTGKNATDSAMIIDAMDLMYTGRFDGFCIISSDSDFTRLAQRLREEGLTVFGFGERKTPESFVAACDKFVYTEVLRPEAPAAAQPAQAKKNAARKPAGKKDEPATQKPEPAKSSARAELPVELIRQAIEEESDETGWAHLGAVGSYLTKIRPDFDSRLYGFSKLSELFKKNPKLFLVEERSTTGVVSKTIYVKAVA